MGVELLALLPWDDPQAGISTSIDDWPPYSFVDASRRRKVRSPGRIRVDADGGLHLLGATEIVHLDAHGAIRGRSPLRDFRDVLLDSSTGRTYVQSKSESSITETDASGTVIDTLRLPDGAGKVFLAGGRLASVFLNERGDLRCVWLFDLRRREASEFACTPEHFAWLVFPLGLDDAARLYVWRDGRVARISRDSAIEELFALNGVAVRAADRAVFTSHGTDDGVLIEGTGGRITLAAPRDFRLVAVDGESRYHLLGPDTPAADGRWLVFSAGGNPEPDAPLPDRSAVECRLSTHDLWQVDPAGGVILPVTTPEGLAVVRIQPHP